MSSNKLKLTLVIAASLLALAACDRSGKKAADTQTPDTAAMNSPAAFTSSASPAATTNAPAMSTTAPDRAGKAGSVKEACADDIKKFCAGADKPGHCLREHESQLSQACSAARAARKAAREAEQSKQ